MRLGAVVASAAYARRNRERNGRAESFTKLLERGLMRIAEGEELLHVRTPTPTARPDDQPNVWLAGISAVVPVFNEEGNIVEMYRELSQVLSDLRAERRRTNPDWNYEILVIDDGSRDRTVELLRASSAGDACLHLIEFRRNFGQTAAMAAGFDHARYDIVATLDGDLQNDPRAIPELIRVLEQGYDLVAGWRKDRHDAFLSRKLPSAIANWIISRSTNVRLHDYGCTLKVMTAEVAKGIRLYGEMHRFIPALADEMGARIAEVPVNHRPRKHGTSKYGISRTIRVILDLITVKFLLGYSKRPIHLFGSVGLISCVVGVVLLGVLTYQRAMLSVPMGNRPLLALGVMLIIIGLQFLVFGLLGEVLARTYYESQGKRIYAVRRAKRGTVELVSTGDETANNPSSTSARQGAEFEAIGSATWNRRVGS